MLAAACFAVATVVDLAEHRVLPAVFTGLATAAFVLQAILYARSGDADRADPTDSV